MRVPNQDQIEKCFNALKSSKRIVYDVETSGLDWKRNFICGYVFTVGERPDETFYLPIRHGGGGNIPGVRIPKDEYDFNPNKDLHIIEKRIGLEVANRPDVDLIGHHLKFDLNFSARHKIFWKGLPECTQVNAALIDENQYEYNLDFCAREAKIPPKMIGIYEFISKFMSEKHGINIEPTKKSMGHFWKLPGDGEAYEYAAQDGITTYELWRYQQAFLDDQDLRRVWALERRVTRTLHRMEQRGVLIDEEKLVKVEDLLNNWLKEAKFKIPKDLNVRSAPQMIKFLSDKGITNWPTTLKGNPSFTEEWLSGFDIGRDIIKVRKISNIINTFINGAIKHHLYNGHIYTGFNQLVADEYGTVTGRLSSSDPNLQQIPKRDKLLAPTLRQIFVAPPGFTWLSNDYSQQEYRIFADYSGAKLVLEAYAKDPRTDYHQLVADMLGVERDPAAKRINLGTIYNMGVKKLALQLGIPLQVAMGYMNKMRRLMPEARSFNGICKDKARSTGFVRTLMGRRRRFPNPDFANKAGNAVIQGSSADVTKLKMVEIDEYLVNEKCQSSVNLQIHDDISMYAHKDEEKHIKECQRIMVSFGENDLIQLTVPMVIDSHHGRHWGEATFPKFNQWVD